MLSMTQIRILAVEKVAENPRQNLDPIELMQIQGGNDTVSKYFGEFLEIPWNALSAKEFLVSINGSDMGKK